MSVDDEIARLCARTIAGWKPFEPESQPRTAVKERQADHRQKAPGPALIGPRRRHRIGSSATACESLSSWWKAPCSRTPAPGIWFRRKGAGQSGGRRSTDGKLRFDECAAGRPVSPMMHSLATHLFLRFSKASKPIQCSSCFCSIEFSVLLPLDRYWADRIEVARRHGVSRQAATGVRYTAAG